MTFLFSQLRESIPALQMEELDVNGTPAALFGQEHIQQVAKVLKEQFGFTYFSHSVGVDRNERKERFEVTYNIRNPKTQERLLLKVRCDERDAHVPSLAGVWSGADWHE